MLDKLEQLGLRGQRKFPNFIQKKGAPFCRLRQPGLRLGRPRIGAFLIAKEFGLDQVLWKRGAIDFYKRPLSRRAIGMDRPRNEPFSSAGLTQNQHRRQFSRPAGTDLREAVNELEHLLHGRTGADYRVALSPRGLLALVIRQSSLVLGAVQGSLHDQPHFLKIKRFA